MSTKEKLSGLKLLNPLGIVTALQAARRIGYLAVVCLRTVACPRVIEEASFTFRTYRGWYAIHCLLLIDVCVAGIVKRSSSDFAHS